MDDFYVCLEFLVILRKEGECTEMRLCVINT